MIRTKLAEVSLGSDGIIRVVVKKEEQTLSDAKEVNEAMRKLGGGQRRAVLVDMTLQKKMDREAQEYWGSEESAAVSKCVALVTSAFVSRVVGNLFLGLIKQRFPIKLFDTADAGLSWLKAQP